MNTYTKSQLRTAAERLQASINDAVAPVSLSWDPALDAQQKLLLNRANEWTSRAFVIIVVGPVKSGKSTFVNLLAHEYVSPTHFLECTVRPSVISRVQDGQSSTITTFESADGLESFTRAEQVESIFDCIKRLEYAQLRGVTQHDYPLTPDNIRRYIESPVDRMLVRRADDHVVLTSITVPGGQFLAEDVFLVDMPGFDGYQANMTDDAYRTIIRRADLVVFIQSSNSAISKISGDFFRELRESNGSAPVCLIHNCFEAASWRDPAVRQQIIDEQLAKARDIITGNGLMLPDENCHSINLGKVADLTTRPDILVPGAADELVAEAERFHDLEAFLYQQITRSQETMRLYNCLCRTRTEKEHLEEQVTERLAALRDVCQRYAEAARAFDAIRTDPYLTPDAGQGVVPLIDADVLLAQLAGICEAVKRNALTADGSYNTMQARQLIRNLLHAYADMTRRVVDERLRPEAIVEPVRTAARQRFAQIQVLAAQHGITVTEPAPAQCPDLQIAYDDICQAYDVEQMIQRRDFFWQGHDYARMLSYYAAAAEAVMGVNPPSQPGIFSGGYVRNEFVPQLLRQLHDHRLQLIASQREVYDALLAEVRTSVLRQITPDIQHVEQHIAQLDGLLSALQSLKIEL